MNIISFYVWESCWRRQELKNKERFFHIRPAVILIGSFLFSVIWEAKARYTFPSLPFMMIVAVYGWGNLTERLFTKGKQLKSRKC